jgi:hypothetical protein
MLYISSRLSGLFGDLVSEFLLFVSLGGEFCGQVAEARAGLPLFPLSP